MRLVLAIMMLCAGTAQSTEAPKELGFADLPDPAAFQFDDPFRDMGTDMLAELKTVVRLNERLGEADLEPDTRQRLEALRATARRTLADNGHDIDALLDQRWTVAEKRMRARLATNPAFEGAEATLDGYMIPAGTGEDGLAVGYLVSAVGICSHLPAPPPNELVRLHVDPSMMTESIYLPVRVTGTLRTEASDETIFLLDGHVRMESLWRLDARDVVVNGPAGIAKVSNDPLDPLQGSPEDRSSTVSN